MLCSECTGSRITHRSRPFSCFIPFSEYLHNTRKIGVTRRDGKSGQFEEKREVLSEITVE